MSTISDQLDLLASTKNAIKNAIEGKGQTVGAIPFSQYPAKITAIDGGIDDISTESAMWALLTSASAGKVVRFTGTSPYFATNDYYKMALIDAVYQFRHLAMTDSFEAPATLPEGYTPLAWLKSDGNQYIGTDILDSADSYIEVTMRISIAAKPAKREIGGFSGNYHNYYGFGNNYDFLDLSPTIRILKTLDYGQVYDVVLRQTSTSIVMTLKQGGDTVDSITDTSSAKLDASKLNFFRSGSLSGYNIVSQQIHGSKVVRDGTLIGDFRPALRTSDSKPGMYDLTGSAFYVNAGSGEFTYA